MAALAKLVWYSIDIMHTQNLSARAKSFFEMIEFDEQEELICEIRKHPFGLFLIYFTGIFVSMLVFLFLVIIPLTASSNFMGMGINIDSIRSVVVVVGFLLTIVSVIGTLIGAYLYTADVVLITS